MSGDRRTSPHSAMNELNFHLYILKNMLFLLFIAKIACFESDGVNFLPAVHFAEQGPGCPRLERTLCVRLETTPVQAAGYHCRSLRQRHAPAWRGLPVVSLVRAVRCGVPLMFPGGENAEASLRQIDSSSQSQACPSVPEHPSVETHAASSRLPLGVAAHRLLDLM